MYPPPLFFFSPVQTAETGTRNRLRYQLRLFATAGSGYRLILREQLKVKTPTKESLSRVCRVKNRCLQERGALESRVLLNTMTFTFRAEAHIRFHRARRYHLSSEDSNIFIWKINGFSLLMHKSFRNTGRWKTGSFHERQCQ